MVKVVDEVVCLCGLVISNVEVRPGITRRIGEARSIFKKNAAVLESCKHYMTS